jgi:hypothetical protein
MKSYDSKCRDLAEHFLEDYRDHPRYRELLLDELAQRIQDAVEDFLFEQERLDNQK